MLFYDSCSFYEYRCCFIATCVVLGQPVVLMLGLSEAVDQLTMANSVRSYGHVLRR